MTDRRFRVGISGIVGAAVLVAACAGEPAKNSEAPLAAKVQALRVQGHRAMDRGDRARARAMFEEARQLAESLDDLPCRPRRFALTLQCKQSLQTLII